MRSLIRPFLKDFSLTIAVLSLLVFGVMVLVSLDRNIFPLYFIYIFAAISVYWFFSQIDFEIISLFAKQLYVVSIILLLATLIIGQITRGTLRWISIGPLSFQAAEIIRPFILVFFANFLTSERITFKRICQAVGLMILPVLLIAVQPSLGVSILTLVGFVGILLAVNFKKKYLLFGLAVGLLILPFAMKLMAPYQRQRLLTFLEPASDPLGAGYNSLQSTIAVGSGKLFGTGLGKGIQTQLAFLPEKQTDFIFAATAEELGFLGSGLVLLASAIILLRLIHFAAKSVSLSGRAYLSGFFLAYLFQIFVHTGMNIGILPITGIPFPLLSAGGSSLVATMIGLGIALGAYKR
jgi:rod shape determining protein RodA